MITASGERQISVAEWHALAQQGIVLRICIPLDGESMRPLIRRGRDPVTIVPLAGPLRRGEVVLFEYPAGRYVVHRVYRIRGERVQTLGDHCWYPDPWMPRSCVLGTAQKAERDGKCIPLSSAPARVLGCCWMAGLPLRRLWWRSKAFACRILKRWCLWRR